MNRSFDSVRNVSRCTPSTDRWHGLQCLGRHVPMGDVSINSFDRAGLRIDEAAWIGCVPGDNSLAIQLCYCFCQVGLSENRPLMLNVQKVNSDPSTASVNGL